MFCPAGVYLLQEEEEEENIKGSVRRRLVSLDIAKDGDSEKMLRVYSHPGLVEGGRVRPPRPPR